MAGGGFGVLGFLFSFPFLGLPRLEFGVSVVISFSFGLPRLKSGVSVVISFSFGLQRLNSASCL